MRKNIEKYNTLIEKQLSDGAKVLNLGELSLPSGKIIVCDPFVGFRNKEYLHSKGIPKQASVSVLKVNTKEWGYRYALAQLVFSDEPIVKWGLAKYGWSTNFFVDSGLCCYMDSETCLFYTQFIDSFYAQNPLGNIYDELFAPLFKANADQPDNPHDSGNWINFILPNNQSLNVCMFQSGLGDGHYESFWGYTVNGEIAKLITDFKIL